MAIRIELEHDGRPADRQTIFDLLEDYNASRAGPEAERPLALLIRDDNQVVLGGLWGLTYYRWLFIELLFVPRAIRRQGIGTRLVHEAEAEAGRRGCHGVWLETFTFQAPEFYYKLGYATFGDIPDYPPGHGRIFMLKRITLAS
jgi:GNAT superfamily N-acetyltransferase